MGALDFDEALQEAKNRNKRRRTRREGSSDKETSFKCLNGKTLTLGSERFRCPEVLFRPSLVGKEFPGIHSLVYDSIQKCEVDLRKNLYRNIVLCGGSTLFPGFEERLEKELKALTSYEINLVAPKDRGHTVWRGGAVLASLPAFQNSWVSKQE